MTKRGAQEHDPTKYPQWIQRRLHDAEQQIAFLEQKVEALEAQLAATKRQKWAES